VEINFEGIQRKIGKMVAHSSSSAISDYRLRRSEDGRINESRQLEEKYFDFIKQGDADGLIDYMKELPMDITSKIGEMSTDKKKEIEYGMVILVTLATRAAIEAGVNHEKAYDISDVYLQKISRCMNIEDYIAFQVEASLLFATLAKAHLERAQLSNYVKMSIEYIERNLTKELSCDIVAQHLGISAYYLSRMFKKEMGLGMNHFIQSERIKAACNQLKYSQASLSEISNYLGFPNQSYFGRVFKKITGITPGRYRIENKTMMFR